MFFDVSNSIISSFAPPVLCMDRNRQTSELLVNECQLVICAINAKLAPNTKFAFEVKHFVNVDCYSDSFTQELKKMLTAYYTFHRYIVLWDNNTLQVSWAPIPAPTSESIKNSGCVCENLEFDDDKSNDLRGVDV